MAQSVYIALRQEEKSLFRKILTLIPLISRIDQRDESSANPLKSSPDHPRPTTIQLPLNLSRLGRSILDFRPYCHN